MSEKTPDRKGGKAGKTASGQTREARLKAALKANMARRKAQAKVRGAKPGSGPVGADIGDAEASPNKDE